MAQFDTSALGAPALESAPPNDFNAPLATAIEAEDSEEWEYEYSNTETEVGLSSQYAVTKLISPRHTTLHLTLRLRRLTQNENPQKRELSRRNGSMQV